MLNLVAKCGTFLVAVSSLDQKPIIWQDFCRKLHENERNWIRQCFPSPMIVDLASDGRNAPEKLCTKNLSRPLGITEKPNCAKYLNMVLFSGIDFNFKTPLLHYRFTASASTNGDICRTVDACSSCNVQLVHSSRPSANTSWHRQRTRLRWPQTLPRLLHQCPATTPLPREMSTPVNQDQKPLIVVTETFREQLTGFGRWGEQDSRGCSGHRTQHTIPTRQKCARFSKTIKSTWRP